MTFNPYINKLSVLLITALLILSGCHTTNVADIKPGERPAADSDIGGMWYQVEKLENRIKNSPSRIRDEALNKYISDIACEIAGDYCSDIRVYIVDIPYFNASMYPNGMMIVWSGFLLRAQTKDQVASVIGHEVGHYVKQHSLRRMRQAKNLNNFLLGIGMVSYTGGLIGNLAGQATLFKFSRDHERESDEYGLKRLEQLGYDPKAAAQLWVLIKQEADQLPANRTPLYLLTHPSTEERIKNLGGSKDMPLDSADEVYLDLISRHYENWLKREVSKRSYDSSEVVLNRLAHTDSNNAQIPYYLAELHRRKNQDNDLETASRYYQQAIKKGYSDPSIYKKLAELNIKQGVNDQAIRNYQKFIQLAQPEQAEKLIIEQKILSLKAQ